MNEAPTATLKPAERVVRVIKSNEVKANVSQIESSKAGDRAFKANEDAISIENIKSELQTQITTSQDIQKVRGTLDRLKAGITGQTRKEGKAITRLESQIKDKDKELKAKEDERDKIQSEADITGKTFRHAETIAEANRRNISADSGRRNGETPRKLSEAERVARKKQAATEFQKLDPNEQKAIKEEKRDVDWQERVVLIRESPTLTEKLNEQSELSNTLKFYDENSEGINKYKAEPKYLMPASMINKLKQIVLESENSTLSSRGDKEINMALVRITPIYEEIVKLTEKNGGQMDEQLIIDAFTEGLNISALKSEKNNYYHISAWVMNEFFANNKNIVGEARYPYIIAYEAGEMLNGNIADPLINLRNLLAGSIPVKQSAGNTESLGFGFVVEKNPLNGQGYMNGMETADPAVIEAFTKANKIALEVFETTKKRSFFTRGALTGDYLDINKPDFSRMTPTLRQPSTE